MVGRRHLRHLCTLAVGVCAWTRAARAATFTVNSVADLPDAVPGNAACETANGDGVCSLRAAVQEANAFPGADTINLATGTYVLTRAGQDDSASNGDLDITDDL